MLLTADYIWVNGQARTGYGVDITEDGRIGRVEPWDEKRDVSDLHLKDRLIIPGLINSHSHVFQRLIRGRTQVSSGSPDSFWTWRTSMYRAAQRLDPETMHQAAAQAILEMVLSGTTSLGEFHYVHNQSDGTSYQRRGELAHSVAKAAELLGIRMRLLRVVYHSSGFGSLPEGAQRRFCDRDIFESIDCIEELRAEFENYNNIEVGVAAHSIRAMSPRDICQLKETFPGLPFHIHVSEQPKEVEDCRSHYGTTPIALLAENGVLDGWTTLVHGTHATPAEVELIAQAKSTVCFCPTTEADLGDGIGPADQYYRQGVPLSLGSDGQTLCNLWEEMRRLESHARLATGRRSVLAKAETDSPGVFCFEAATRLAKRAVGFEVGELQAGHWADLVGLDLTQIELAGWSPRTLMDSIVFSGAPGMVKEVMVGGRFIVLDGKHPAERDIVKSFQRASQIVFVE